MFKKFFAMLANLFYSDEKLETKSQCNCCKDGCSDNCNCDDNKDCNCNCCK